MTDVQKVCELELAAIVATLRHKRQILQDTRSSFARGLGKVVVDSRKLMPGDCFVAFRGINFDAHQFIPNAIAKRAGLLVVENDSLIPADCVIPYIVVKSGRASWSYLAAEANQQPQDQLKILAVTGTNGKTSTTWMAGEIFRSAGHKCLTIGTLGADFGEGPSCTTHTTPDPDVLFALLKEAVTRGVKLVVMEASSHAVVQEKLSPLRFTAAAFTSFSRDHLDFHGSMTEYFAAKERVFTTLCMPNARHVIWSGLDEAHRFVRNDENVFFYGEHAEKLGVNYLTIDETIDNSVGTLMRYRRNAESKCIQIPYFGKHAIENFCAALLLAESQMEIPFSDFSKLRQVPGRLELVSRRSNEPKTVVDYAHTPDALKKTLEVLRTICRGKLIVVFGCGGDRDRGKRPMMGQLAEQLADLVYVTSDNPRSEDPSIIIDEILSGFKKSNLSLAIIDREQAIREAIRAAKPEDTVIIAGKGHETYQIIGNNRLSFDDREIARKALNTFFSP